MPGPFLDKCLGFKPDDMQARQRLPQYASAREKIAEQFHMSEELLSTLNPGKISTDQAKRSRSCAGVSSYRQGRQAGNRHRTNSSH